MQTKKIVAAVLAIATLSASAFPISADAADEYFHATFEDGLDGWDSRGSAMVSLSSSEASSGSKSAAVSGRTESWNGIAKNLDSTVFTAGSSYSFSIMVKSATAAHFKLSLQYTTGSGEAGAGGFGDFGGFGGFGGGGTTSYASVAEKDVAAGEWTQLANASYTIPEGATNLVLYVETEDSTDDFYVDELIAAKSGTEISSGSQGSQSSSAVPGDVNEDKKVDAKDAAALQGYLLNKNDSINAKAADFDGNNKVNAVDLALLKKEIMNPKPTTTTTTVTTTTTTTVQQPQSGGQSPTAYMESVRKTVTIQVPGNMTSKPANNGTVTHFTYHSEYANRDKGANVWLPAGYTESKKYPVVYCNHGIMGGENDMVGMGIPEIAGNLIAAGEAEEMIIVFPQMYTSKQSASPSGINVESCKGYDDFVYDIADSLMPYIESHYSVKTGRENTAICGFSMGGRESLYIGVVRNDLFGYIGCAAPAPGVTPGVDMFMTHPGCMQESELKITGDKPWLLMIAGGTNDTVVGTFPEQYHNILTKNGEDHVWISVPGAGHDGSTVTPLMYNFLRNIFK